MPAGARESAGDGETVGTEIMVEGTGGGGKGIEVATPGDEATGPMTVAEIFNRTIFQTREPRRWTAAGGREVGMLEAVVCTVVADTALVTVTLTVETVAVEERRVDEAFDVSILKKTG